VTNRLFEPPPAPPAPTPPQARARLATVLRDRARWYAQVGAGEVAWSGTADVDPTSGVDAHTSQVQLV
jgi:hypothetical protein